MSYYKGNGEFELKKIIVDIGKRLWQRVYIAANVGNISVKINDNEIALCYLMKWTQKQLYRENNHNFIIALIDYINKVNKKNG